MAGQALRPLRGRLRRAWPANRTPGRDPSRRREERPTSSPRPAVCSADWGNCGRPWRAGPSGGRALPGPGLASERGVRPLRPLVAPLVLAGRARAQQRSGPRCTRSTASPCPTGCHYRPTERWIDHLSGGVRGRAWTPTSRLLPVNPDAVERGVPVVMPRRDGIHGHRVDPSAPGHNTPRGQSAEHGN